MKWVKIGLCIVITAAGIYAGIQFGMPQFKYRAFKADVEELAKLPHGLSDVAVKESVMSKAQEHGIPVTEETVLIQRVDYGFRIQASWKKTVDLLGQYQKTYNFTVDVSP